MRGFLLMWRLTLMLILCKNCKSHDLEKSELVVPVVTPIPQSGTVAAPPPPPYSSRTSSSSGRQRSSLASLKDKIYNSPLFSTVSEQQESPPIATEEEEQETSQQSLQAPFCDFENPCPWTGIDDGFIVTSGVNISSLDKGMSGPQTDADGKPNGHFLYLRGRTEDKGKHKQVYSEWYNSTTSECRVSFSVHVNNVLDSKVQILTETLRTSVVIADITIANNRWTVINKPVGTIKQRVRLILEVWIGETFPSHAAFDNITLINCLPVIVDHGIYSGRSFECQPGNYIDRDRVCDIRVDCPNGRDEKQKCDQLALRWNAYCNFEGDMCGWENSRDDDMEWIRLTNISDNDGPLHDHTFSNASGHFVYINTTLRGTMGHSAVIRSVVFPPPPRGHGDSKSPHHKSCKVRFYYRMFGRHKPVGSLSLNLVLLNRTQQKGFNETLWKRQQSEDRNWHRVTVSLPNIQTRYRLEFVGTRGLRHTGHISIDDVSLSPDCLPHNETYEFKTCGAKGARGPTQQNCTDVYRNTSVNVTIDNKGTLAGIQKWIVPATGFYSVVAKGAGGGKVDENKRISRGSTAGGVFNFTKGEIIYILVGQQGSGACSAANCLQNKRIKKGIAALQKVLKYETKEIRESGSGGGGASYVFKMNSNGKPTPLLVAAGGGGLAHIMNTTGLNPDGHGENFTLKPINGFGAVNGAGGGGGWTGVTKKNSSSGLSLMEGSIGGSPCPNKSHLHVYGGFGGGGGGCMSGGGGGGFTGGDAAIIDIPAVNGLGGYSYSSGSFPYTRAGVSGEGGDGSVNITPAVSGCGCDYLCVILADENNPYACLCPENFDLDVDDHRCLISSLQRTEEMSPFISESLVVILPIIIIIIVCISTVMFIMYHRYRRQLAETTRQEYINNPEMQLNRLRQTADGVGAGMVTEYNPNYEFGGSTCTLQDLREVPRESLSLVKALGQGAFGEVYQGCLANIPIQVAIKTLPELSSSQSEMDFLTEALIMSKFNHPNIVKFIGVCFDKLPKFIILELLPGGDLKSFLRESRPKPDKPSPLTMIDLLKLAIDVAKGCKYLEENHFIHRDIAARNCLLTTKDVKRVVKIADFGMARDIYRADYYRKGGKAMLPVKWMPPEAFLDGIFTSKTDVWSFGVLLWEVMSMGYMPYPGRGNQDVMQLVTSGGRLEPPSNCPQPLYRIMSQCWHPAPEERPNFTTILERLGYCLQDPDVLNAPLPVFHRPPSTERDTTVMRPSDSDNVCLQVQRLDNEPQSPASTDYLIPIPSSSYSLCTEKTELQSASSMESVDHLLELDDKGQMQVPPIPPSQVTTQPSSWETSFMQKRVPGVTATTPTPTWSGGYQSVPTQEDPLPVQSPMGSIVPPSSQHLSGSVRGIPFTTIPPPESSPARKSPPSAIARQRPSVKKPIVSGSATGGLFQLETPHSVGSEVDTKATPLPLDPSTLSKQHPTQVLPYVNVSVSNPSAHSDVPTRSTLYGEVHSEPYTITAPRGATPSASKQPSEKEPKC